MAVQSLNQIVKIIEKKGKNRLCDKTKKIQKWRFACDNPNTKKESYTRYDKPIGTKKTGGGNHIYMYDKPNWPKYMDKNIPRKYQLNIGPKYMDKNIPRIFTLPHKHVYNNLMNI